MGLACLALPSILTVGVTGRANNEERTTEFRNKPKATDSPGVGEDASNLFGAVLDLEAAIYLEASIFESSIYLSGKVTNQRKI